VIEIERISRLEEQRELTAFRSEPESIFAAEHVHVGLSRAGGDRGPSDPTEARRMIATGRARHHTSLVLGCYGDAPGSTLIGQQHDLGVLPQKRDVRLK
jgi:hypothetical protein